MRQTKNIGDLFLRNVNVILKEKVEHYTLPKKDKTSVGMSAKQPLVDKLLSFSIRHIRNF